MQHWLHNPNTIAATEYIAQYGSYILFFSFNINQFISLIAASIYIYMYIYIDSETFCALALGQSLACVAITSRPQANRSVKFHTRFDTETFQYFAEITFCINAAQWFKLSYVMHYRLVQVVQPFSPS